VLAEAEESDERSRFAIPSHSLPAFEESDAGWPGGPMLNVIEAKSGNASNAISAAVAIRALRTIDFSLMMGHPVNAARCHDDARQDGRL
jgi:hypothetical protein